MAKIMRDIIEIDEELCTGCGECVPSCEEGAIQIIDGVAKVVQDRYCDGLGACLGACPEGALKIIQREAEDFDEEAAMEHVARMKQVDQKPAGGGCPGSMMRDLNVACAGAKPAAPQGEGRPSALAHWPVKIRLVPPEAPFLKDADMLVAADCAPFAYNGLHEDFLKGRVLLSGCPKFDDVDLYIEKFAAIFSVNPPKTITAVRMEVPCCMGLTMILRKAMDKAGVDIPMDEIIISLKGEVKTL